MNDRYNNGSVDSDSGTDIADIAENGTEMGNDTPTESGTGDTDSTLSDTMGSTDQSIADTEASTDGTENTSDIGAENSTESSMENPSDSSETSPDTVTVTEQIDYTPEIEYIDYLLNEQLNEMKSVKTVSGNSIVVTFDDTGSQLLADIKTNQQTIIDGQAVAANLISCLLLAVMIEFMSNSAKRVSKKLFNRKE